MAMDRAYHTLGNSALLELHKVAFLCSRDCPADLGPYLLEWAGRQCAEGSCVISGFHSRMEKLVFERLLQGSQPVIVALASGLQPRLAAQWQEPLACGRLLALTRYAPSVTHPCAEKCFQRNRLMMELADEIVVAYASPGGSLERLCREFWGVKPVRSVMQAGKGTPPGR